MCEVIEPWMYDLLSRLLPEKPGAFLDVGVNLGQTLIAVKACEPDRHYVGLEPNPHCVAYAEQLIRMNGLADCLIVPVGLGAEAGLRRLQLYAGSFDPSASLVENFRPEHAIHSLKIVPVFSFPALEQALRLSALGVVKIDVEGGEAEILCSMREALQRDKPWLIVEILPCWNAEHVERIERQQTIEQLLDDIGYIKLRILRGPDGHLQHLSPVARIGIHENLDWSDYLLCPGDDIDRIVRLAPVA